jgi:hypothetical protein
VPTSGKAQSKPWCVSNHLSLTRLCSVGIKNTGVQYWQERPLHQQEPNLHGPSFARPSLSRLSSSSSGLLLVTAEQKRSRVVVPPSQLSRKYRGYSKSESEKGRKASNGVVWSGRRWKKWPSASAATVIDLCLLSFGGGFGSSSPFFFVVASDGWAATQRAGMDRTKQDSDLSVRSVYQNYLVDHGPISFTAHQVISRPTIDLGSNKISPCTSLPPFASAQINVQTTKYFFFRFQFLSLKKLCPSDEESVVLACLLSILASFALPPPLTLSMNAAGRGDERRDQKAASQQRHIFSCVPMGLAVNSAPMDGRVITIYRASTKL